MWKSLLAVSHMLAHQEPSLNQTTLSARFVPVGVPVPAWDSPSNPTSPGAARATFRQEAHAKTNTTTEVATTLEATG
jgi:hypothetical protein